MAENSYPTSDIESGELDFANDWLQQAIYKQVSRGAKLRERKLGALNVTSKYSKPPTPAKGIGKDRRKPSASPNRSNDWDQLRGRARSDSPFQSTRTSTSTPLSGRDSSSTSARRGRPVCSMRISQLAVPTKRQCIDTWRKNASVLPEPMLYRLKQQVMDQTPIVKVSDAVNCFRQSTSSTSKKRPPRKINKEAMINRNKEENQYISTIFGHKIAQKLIRPVNAKLNSQLQNVSSVISSEICNVMRDKTKLKTDLATHERMVRETAEKVTIWIANILEETSGKLLEEDLKVKKFHERASFVTDGDLITVIGSIMCQEAAELEEQEGPALDILDDLVNDVVNVCGGAESDLEDILDAASSLKKSIDNISTTDYVSVSSGNDEETGAKAISPVQQALNEYLDEADKKSVDDDESLKRDLIKQLNEIIDSNVIDTLKANDIVENSGEEINKETEFQSNTHENRQESNLLSKDGQMDIQVLVENQKNNQEAISLQKEQYALDGALNKLDKADSGPEKEAMFDETLNSENNNDTAENEAYSDSKKEAMFDNTMNNENNNDTLEHKTHSDSEKKTMFDDTVYKENNNNTAENKAYSDLEKEAMFDDTMNNENKNDTLEHKTHSDSEKESMFDDAMNNENKNDTAEHKTHSDSEKESIFDDTMNNENKNDTLENKTLSDLEKEAMFDDTVNNENNNDTAETKAHSSTEKEATFYDTMSNENNNDRAENKAHSDKIREDQADESIFLLADDHLTDDIDVRELNMNEEQKAEVHEEQKSNMSAELSEDRDKKVQFSYDNFGTLIENQQHSNEKIPKQASARLKQGILIGKSNENLLSLRNMDEPWPQDLLLENITKPGESVSKSVTSLGKILESDERNLLSPEETLSGKDQVLALHLRPESIEQFNSFGVNYEDFLVNDENNHKEKQSTPLHKVNGSDLKNAAEPKHDLEDRIEIGSGETNEHFSPKQAITITLQEETRGHTTGGHLEDTSGESKPHTTESVDQQELIAQIKGKELEASLNQLKQEIKKMNIPNESSEPSLVSVMLSKLKKHDDKIQGIVSNREQSYSYITKMHTALSERSKHAPHSPQRKLNGKIYQRPSRPEEMAAKKFDYRVHPNTAPSWIRRGRGQGDLGSCPPPRPQGYTGTDGMRQRELEIRKRCKDLDEILMNLEKWKSWLEYITKYITSLKYKAELKKSLPAHTNKTITSERPKPPRSIEKEMWTKLNHRAKEGLRLYKNDETIKFKISPTAAPAKYCYTCGKKQMKRVTRSPTGKEMINTKNR